MAFHSDEIVDLQGMILSSYGPNEKFHLNNQFIKFIFECMGMVNVTDDVLTEISRSVTFKLINILTEAVKLCRKSNRTKLTCSDIDNALILSGFEYFVLNERVYNNNSLIRLLSNNRSQTDIYFFYDDEIDIDEYLAASRLKCRPQNDVGLKAHWLAISGVQPCIPENPLNMSNTDALVKLQNLGDEFVPISLHLQIFYKEITEASIGTVEDKRKEALTSLQRDPATKYILAPLCSFIYQGIRLNIASRNLAILIYIMRMVCSIIQNPAITPEIMEHHFHEIIPSTISCILSPEQCSKKFEENHWALRTYSAKLICSICTNYENFVPHLKANILEVIINSLETSVNEVEINEETLDILSNNQPYDILEFPFGTHFGALFTLSLFPKDINKSALMPLLKRESLIFEALNFKLETTNHDFLKRDIKKAEMQLIQLISCLMTKEELNDPLILESMVGKYMKNTINTATSEVEQKL